MKRFSEQLHYIGFSCLSLPGITITNQSILKFQQEINNNGLDFTKLERLVDNKGTTFGLTVIREAPSPLQITVNMMQAPTAQFTVIAPIPKTTKDLFIDEVGAAINAFQSTWISKSRQVMQSDGTIRELLEVSGDVNHAFQELWEKRLNQPIDSLKIFGKPIRGGGLRFVLDPTPSDQDPVQIEIKIESFLQDTRKIFVEAIFNWFAQSVAVDVKARIDSMDKYMKEHVHRFIFGDKEDEE